MDITLILKCTRECNLACTYCTDRRKKSKSYDIPFVAQMFNEIKNIEDLQRVTFVWHGGEPLLLGIPFFRKIHFLQDKFFSSEIDVFNTLQTNACLLDEEWIDHLKEYKFQIGVSLDGTPDIHDKTRVFARDGKGSFHKVNEGLELLKKSGINFGILTVISENMLEKSPRDLFDFFEEKSIRRFALLSLRKNWKNKKDAIDYNRTFGEYMAEAIRYRFEKDEVETKIREIDSKLNLFFRLPNTVCKDGGSCVGKYFSVEPEGLVSHCDKFTQDERFCFGNILNTPFNELIKSQKVKDAVEYEKSIREKCKPCPWYSLCKGGCLSDLMDLHKAEGRVGTTDCFNFRMYKEIWAFLQHFQKRLQEIS